MSGAGRSLDTSSLAWRKLREVHERLGPEGRVEAAFGASELVRAAATEGLRMRHPEYDAEQLFAALLGRLYGSALAARVLAARASRA